MTSAFPQVIDSDAAIFTISVAAQLAGMHPQTLRSYDRIGLVSPRRAPGRGRRYSPRDVARLRLIQHLSQQEGINLNGIRRILELEDHLLELERQVAELRQVAARASGLGRDLALGRPRVFTAETSGAVHLGRISHGQRALPSR